MAKKRKSSSNRLEVQNAAKTMYANIRFMSVDDPICSIVMTSTIPNEGKSTSSIELARAIGSSGKRVLLVEADMRRRSLSDAIGVRTPAGLYAVLSDEAELKDAIVETDVPNVYFMDVEPSIPNPADIISSKRFRKLMATFEQDFDYVLYDTPPVGTFVDAAILGSLADATVLVVKPGAASRDELLKAYEQLQKAEANVIGICATFCENSSSEYYYAYYTKDGKRADDSAIESSQQASPAASMQLPERTGSFEPITEQKPTPRSHRRPAPAPSQVQKGQQASKPGMPSRRPAPAPKNRSNGQ